MNDIMMDDGFTELRIYGREFGKYHAWCICVCQQARSAAESCFSASDESPEGGVYDDVTGTGTCFMPMKQGETPAETGTLYGIICTNL